MRLDDLIPVIVLVLYSAQAILLLRRGQYGFALMWFSYALANVGVLIAQRRS